MLRIWANGPAFDCIKIQYHCDVLGLKYPWKFYQERDIRTIKEVAKTIGFEYTPYKNSHTAIEDCRNQSNCLREIENVLKEKCIVKNKKH